MGEHKRNQGPKGPLAHQITEVSISLKNGMQVQTYCIHNKEQLEDQYRNQKLIDGYLKIESGSEAEAFKNSDIMIPVSEIAILAIADVVQPSNIIKPPSGIRLQ